MTDELDQHERRAQEVRGQLALDIDELFVRLQPRRMVRSVGVYAREQRVGDDLGRDVVRDMRKNPIPYLLVGMGIAGLVWAVSSFTRTRTRARLPEFSEADFIPPPALRAVGTPAVTSSPTPTAAIPPVSPASAQPAREISPVTSGEQ
ncbi:MAG: hypothetical protein AB7H71_00485 [Alphaproteobacteria bacterium]